MSETDNRRPLKSRRAAWARLLALQLASADASPDLISAASVAFAALGGALMLWGGLAEAWPLRAVVFVGAAAAIQLRLLCNLLDGMVAVEHGRASSAGPIWNELPDRIADLVLLVAAGYGAAAYAATHGAGGLRFVSPLGWLAGALAILTAYVRELCRGLGFDADFGGPMAKPHRMATLTLTCLFSAVEPLWGWRGQGLAIGLAIITLGAALTVARRTLTLARRLSERAQAGGRP